MKIGIVNLAPCQFDETSINGSLGGSETWAVQFANELARRENMLVYVFAFCKTHKAANGVIWVDNNEIERVFKTEKFDVLIFSRVYSNCIEFIDQYKTCPNVYIQAHDPEIDGRADFGRINGLDIVKGISTLSKYQEDSIHERNNAPLEKMFRIGNGIDLNLFEGLSFLPRQKNIMHSSCYDRGGNIMLNNILPELIKKDKDVTLTLASYSNISADHFENVRMLGGLNKRELYMEMSQNYCWAYPLINDETFCITMIENAMCENDLILPMAYGNTSVLEPFVDRITMQHSFIKGDEEFKLAVDEMCGRIEDSFIHYDEHQELRDEIKNYVIQNYDWKVVVDKWLAAINERM